MGGKAGRVVEGPVTKAVSVEVKCQEAFPLPPLATWFPGAASFCLPPEGIVVLALRSL